MIQCLIVDDEPIAVRVLETHLKKVPDVEVVGSHPNALDALRMLNEHPVDLVFLDIEMPELSGVGLVEALTDPPRIIFTTAHREYAVRGFDLDAVDYLLKPVDFPRLLRAVEKYRRLENTSDVQHVTRAHEPINVRVDRRTVRIAPEDIVYVESLSDYVIIHTDHERYTTKERISNLGEELEPLGIVRIHRSYLAAVDRVDSFTSTEVQLGSISLPISRSYRRAVMRRLEDRSD